MSHEIHVEIPDSTLLETMGLSRNVSTTDQSHNNIPPRMVSQLEKVSSRTSTNTVVSLVSLEAFIADANTDGKQIKSDRSEDETPQINYNENRFEANVSDEKDGKDMESVSDEGIPGIYLGHDSAHIANSPPATISSTRSHLGGSLFVKGNREQTRKFGIPSPYRRALQLSEDAASENFACNSDVTHEFERKSQEDRVSSRLPLKLTTSISSGLGGLVMISPDQIQSASTAEIEVNSSEAYDADEEYGSERSEEPNMGPKSSWEKARADRQRRYQFVRSMSAETASDYSDVQGLELRPMKDQLHAHDNASHLTPKSRSSAATPGSLRRVRFESVLNPADFTQIPVSTSVTNEPPTGAEIEFADNEREQNVANLEALKQVSNVQRLLAAPSSCLQENRLPILGLQMRTCSAHSNTTSSSCAVTTSSQLCYRPAHEESHHIGTYHPRRTSSVTGEIDQVRHDLEGSKPYHETPISPRLNEESGYLGFSAIPSVVRDNTIRPTASVEKPFDSIGNHSMPTILSNTKTEKTRPLSYNELGKRSTIEANKSGSFVEDLSVETLPPLPESGSTPYHESLADIRTHRSMPGAFEPFPEKQSLESSSRNSQEVDTRKDIPNLFVTLSDTRPSSVDFSIMNPEVDHYLDQAFSDVPYRMTESEYSDEENGFRTPITTPGKQNHRAKNLSGSFIDLDSPRDRPSDQTALTCQLRGASNVFVAARLPKFAATPADIVDSLAGDEGPTSAYDEYSMDDFMFPNHIMRPALSSSRSHHRNRSWQMKDISCGGGEFTYHSGDSPHAQLQTSSLKKGVWWTRVQEMLKESESPCAERQTLQALDDGLDDAKDTLRSVEECINESNMNIDDLKALLGVDHTRERQDETSLRSTAMQADGWEDDNLAIATERYLTVENGIQQNRKTISDINALLEKASPFITKCVSRKGSNHIIRDGKKDIHWNDRHIINKYQVRAPPGVEDSINPTDIIQEHRLRFDVEQGQDAEQFASLFSHSITPFKGFQTLHQEIETSVESLQSEKMVSCEESNRDIIVSLPHAIRNDRLRISEDSWYSFEMD
ncbi:hypothetical protein MMC17_006518 [Xylographa soralifera]|nr:hypothetical protein [Xylographa soralifera]